MAPNAESHILQIKIIKYLLPGLFLLKIFFSFSHNEYKTPIKKGGSPFSFLRKKTSKGQFRLRLLGQRFWKQRHLCLAEIKTKHKGVVVALKKVFWTRHFGNMFMESSVMADILNRSNFYFTFSYNLRIL